MLLFSEISRSVRPKTFKSILAVVVIDSGRTLLEDTREAWLKPPAMPCVSSDDTAG